EGPGRLSRADQESYSARAKPEGHGGSARRSAERYGIRLRRTCARSVQRGARPLTQTISNCLQQQKRQRQYQGRPQTPSEENQRHQICQAQGKGTHEAKVKLMCPSVMKGTRALSQVDTRIRRMLQICADTIRLIRAPFSHPKWTHSNDICHRENIKSLSDRGWLISGIACITASSFSAGAL